MSYSPRVTAASLQAASVVMYSRPALAQVPDCTRPGAEEDSEQVSHVSVQPPSMAPAPVLYLPLAQATHDPSLVHVSVFTASFAAGHEQPERYVPAEQPFDAHGV